MSGKSAMRRWVALTLTGLVVILIVVSAVADVRRVSLLLRGARRRGRVSREEA